MIKLKNYMKKFQELKNNIMQLSLIFKVVGNNKEDNGNKVKTRIVKNMKILKKNSDKNKDNGNQKKSIYNVKLTRGKDKTKNSNSLSRKCKPTQKD